MKQVFQNVPAGSSSRFVRRVSSGVKSMNRKLMVIFAAALLMVPAVPLIMASAGLTVQIGPKYYNVGDIVAIRGTAAANATVQIDITHETDSVFSTTATANATGGYEASYTIPSAAPTGIYTITATSGTDSDDTVFMVTSVSTAEMATQLIASAEQSQILAQETIQSIIDLNYTMPSAVNASMTQGANAIVDAKAFYTQGLYIAAAEAAQRAMTHFKNAMTLAIRASHTEDRPYEDENSTLTHQVEMLTDEAERITEVVATLSGAGENVTAVEALVASAKSSLASATLLIESGSYDEAAAAINSARSDLHDAMQLIKDAVKEVRRGLMEEFKNRLQARINATTSDLNGLRAHIMAANMTATMQRFGAANGFIHRAETRLNEGLDDDALNDLEEANNEYNNGLNDVDNNGYSQSMKQMNTIRAQIQVLQQLEETLKSQGQDTSAVEAKIQELQALLDEGMGMMQNGNANGANDLFEDNQGGGDHGMGGGMGGHGHGNNKK